MPKRSHHNYTVYILTNKPNGTLYIGVTGGLDNRMERHIKKHKINFKIWNGLLFMKVQKQESGDER